MKRFNFFLTAVFLSFTFVACEKDEGTNQKTEETGKWLEQNAENIESFKKAIVDQMDVFADEKNIVQAATERFTPTEIDSEVRVIDYRITEKEYDTGRYPNRLFSKTELSDVFTNKQRTFLAAYGNELAKTQFLNIIFVIQEYKAKANNYGFTKDERDQVKTILGFNEAWINGLERQLTGQVRKNQNLVSRHDGFWDCVKATGGRAIGEAMMEGVLVGGIAGGIAGAGGGTVVFPILGTTTGAVGGAVFGAAAGAASAGTSAAVWTVLKCLRYANPDEGSGGADSWNWGSNNCSPPRSNTSGEIEFGTCGKLVDGRNSR